MFVCPSVCCVIGQKCNSSLDIQKVVIYQMLTSLIWLFYTLRVHVASQTQFTDSPYVYACLRRRPPQTPTHSLEKDELRNCYGMNLLLKADNAALRRARRPELESQLLVYVY